MERSSRVGHYQVAASGSAEVVVTGSGRFLGGTIDSSNSQPGGACSVYDSGTGGSGLPVESKIAFGYSIPSAVTARGGLRFENGLSVDGATNATGLIYYTLDEDVV